MMNWIKAQLCRIRTWWNNNHTTIGLYLTQGTRRLKRGMNRFSANILRVMAMGIIINIIASFFYPEFSTRFPVIYGWFDGWLQLCEFAAKGGLGGSYALFTGHWSEFLVNYTSASNELLQQFVNWLSILHF